MAKPKSDADILALFDKISAEVKKHGPGTKRAISAAPRFNAVKNEWSDLDMAAVFSAEIEERKQWFVTGLVLLRQRQNCICGRTHDNCWGVFTREQHRNGTLKLRKPRPDDYTAGEVLPRHEEWLEEEQVHDCPECFLWGERRSQHDFPFECNGTVRPDVVAMVTKVAAELEHHSTTDAAKHNYFTQELAQHESSTEDASAESPADTDEKGQSGLEDVLAFFERHAQEPGAE